MSDYESPKYRIRHDGLKIPVTEPARIQPEPEGREEFEPEWTLDPVERMSVNLSISLSKHIPNWPGATDEQLMAVAKDIVELES